jgi:AraC-like DNA-binding protein
MYICNFDMKLLTAGPESAWGLHELLFGHDNAQPAYIQLQGKAYEEGLRLWERIFKEHESSLAWRPIMLRAMLLEALTLFVRNGDKINMTQTDTQRSVSTKGIWPVVQYIYDHYLDPLSLSSLSERFHMHPAQLSTQFGEAFGIYFVDFLHELRIRHACSLLISSDLPISQVAFESGFSSYPTFSRTFLRIKGMPPRQYREQQGRGRCLK